MVRVTGPRRITGDRPDRRLDADSLFGRKYRVRLFPQIPCHGHAKLLQRAERGDGGVGVHHPVEPGIFHRFAAIEQLHLLGAEYLVAHHVAPVMDMVDQEARHHAECRHAFDLFVVQDRAVLDAAA